MAGRRFAAVVLVAVTAFGCGDGASSTTATSGAAGSAPIESTTTAAPPTTLAQTETTQATPNSSAPPGNCGIPDEPGNQPPDLSGVTIEFTPAARLQVIGDVCDNDDNPASATIDNGAGFAASYVIDDQGQFTSSTAGMGHIGYNEPVFVPAGSQITVTVTVTDASGDTSTKTATMTVPIANEAPAFDYSKAVRNGYIVDVQGEAFDPDGQIVTMTVNWGDGTIDTFTQFEAGLLPNGIEIHGDHNYNPNEVQGKKYFVMITVTDNRGSTASASHTVQF